MPERADQAGLDPGHLRDRALLLALHRRIVRGQHPLLREKEFIEAARSLGAGNIRIMFREVLPNLVAPIIVYSTLLIPSNILFEAGLARSSASGVPQSPSPRGGDALRRVRHLRGRVVADVLPGPLPRSPRRSRSTSSATVCGTPSIRATADAPDLRRRPSSTVPRAVAMRRRSLAEGKPGERREGEHCDVRRSRYSCSGQPRLRARRRRHAAATTTTEAARRPAQDTGGRGR